jgi:hypothetical protein
MLGPVNQVTHQRLKRHFALRERPLVKDREDPMGLEQRDGPGESWVVTS